MTAPRTLLPDLTLSPAHATIAALAEAAGLKRIHVLAWRDLEHHWAGGSEIHINEVARCWSEAGLEVTLRTGRVAGGKRCIDRHGYRVLRSGGRFTTLVRAPAQEMFQRRRDALVEVWHGINFATPLWARGPQIGLVHHVHGRQFHEVLPRGLSDTALFLERRVYPRLYQRKRLVALSESTRRALVDLGFDGQRIGVVEPGVADRFTPGGSRSPTPMVLAVSRLMPQKRVDILVDILAELRQRHPTLEATIVGDGPERAAIEKHVRAAGCDRWLHFEGRVDEETLLELYRQAWVLASASSAEGWGMAITEAAACATPTVASRIPGHEDAVIHGVSGLLAANNREFVEHLDNVITDDLLRVRLMRGAVERVRGLRWPDTAARLMRVLAGEVTSFSSTPPTEP